jgi:hypothetical protein
VETNEMKSVFLDLRDEEELKPQKLTETKSEGENPLKINQKHNKK